LLDVTDYRARPDADGAAARALISSTPPLLRQVEAMVPVKCVHATRDKYLRVEPVALLYAQGKVKHVGAGLAALEDELCDFGPDGLSDGRSPDRLDALVWAVTALTARGWEGPRVRSLDTRPPIVPWWAGLRG
jgi:phage terminase large subunit-like protein